MKKLREFIMECYGADIEEAEVHFSTQNYAFVFPDKPYMIRVSMTPTKTRQEILSELLWVEDLKAFKQTICEPSPSLHGRILEEYKMNGVVYRASMFRTARGTVRRANDLDPMYFICVGDLLGAVHEASADQMKHGIRYKRSDNRSKIRQLLQGAKEKLPADVYERLCETEAAVNAIERTEENYGLCHGDFHSNNFFVEANNIWLFDFDGCHYNYYLYDIASFLVDCLMNGYLPEKDAEECLYEDILPYFKIGYELHRKVEESFYEKLELFLSYRALVATTNLVFIDECGVTDKLDRYKKLFFHMVSAPNLLAVLTEMRRVFFAGAGNDGSRNGGGKHESKTVQ